jgi:hypothetical protein
LLASKRWSGSPVPRFREKEPKVGRWRRELKLAEQPHHLPAMVGRVIERVVDQFRERVDVLVDCALS